MIEVNHASPVSIARGIAFRKAGGSAANRSGDETLDWSCFQSADVVCNSFVTEEVFMVMCD
jgi:hypothetical protein